jgi:hypothetical protein
MMILVRSARLHSCLPDSGRVSVFPKKRQNSRALFGKEGKPKILRARERMMQAFSGRIGWSA